MAISADAKTRLKYALNNETDADEVADLLDIVEALTATYAEVNQLDGAILNTMTPGTGISPVTNSSYAASVEKVGSLFKTTILIDLAGLNSGGTANDIIGKAATANCHLGQITAAVNGTIFAGLIRCLEAPTTGDNDIDLYAASVATGTEDAAVTGLDGQAILANCGDHTAGSVDVLTAYPAANSYLYLAGGIGDSDATYATGILLITLWGK